MDACVLQEKTELAALVEKEKATGYATSIRSLAVDGNMLLELNIPQRQIGNVLSFLLDEVLKDPSLNNKESLLKLAKKNFDV